MPESNPFQKSCAYNECSVTRKMRPIRLIGPDDITQSTPQMCYLDEKYQVKKESVLYRRSLPRKKLTKSEVRNSPVPELSLPRALHTHIYIISSLYDFCHRLGKRTALKELRHVILSHFFDGLNYALNVEKPKNNSLLRKKNTKAGAQRPYTYVRTCVP